MPISPEQSGSMPIDRDSRYWRDIAAHSGAILVGMIVLQALLMADLDPTAWVLGGVVALLVGNAIATRRAAARQNSH